MNAYKAILRGVELIPLKLPSGDVVAGDYLEVDENGEVMCGCIYACLHFGLGYTDPNEYYCEDTSSYSGLPITIPNAVFSFTEDRALISHAMATQDVYLDDDFVHSNVLIMLNDCTELSVTEIADMYQPELEAIDLTEWVKS